MKIKKSCVLVALALVLAAISFPIYRAHADGDSQFQFNITPAASGAPEVSSLGKDSSNISFRGTGTLKPDDPKQATQDEGCSNASLQGSFAVTNNGTIVGVGDLALLGRVTADGQGNFVGGSFTQSLNGVISGGTFTGTYQVNADCTGSAITVTSSGRTFHRDIVIVDDGREVRGISTDAGTVVTVNLRKQFAEGN